MIAARLDALPRREKELLQEAAVHGKVFWLGGVAAASGADQPQTPTVSCARSSGRTSSGASARSTVARRHASTSFQHVLLRDVAYGQIPRRARAEKHRRAAEWIEGLGRPDDHAELLAHHYKQALELARAAGVEDDPEPRRADARRAAAAGERALALSAYGAAAEFFADALALAPRTIARRGRGSCSLRARALSPLGGSGLDLLTEALEAFRAAGDVEGYRRGGDARRALLVVSPATARRPTATSATRSPPSPTDPRPARGRRR